MIKLLAALATAAILTAATAHADGPDDQYISALKNHGVTTADRGQLIADAHQTCDAFNQGGIGLGISPRGFALLQLNNALSAQGLNPHDAQQVMMDATRAYCPQFAPPQ
jgi:hypothetical protein